MTARPAAGLIALALVATPLAAAWAEAPAADADKTSSTSAIENPDMTAAEARKVADKTRPRAESGEAAAQYNMGVLYDRGLGVTQDYDTARQWYEKAAKQRYGRAEHNLGIMYESGKGVDKNMVKAAQWFRRGADDGQAASQNNLGVLYMQGKGLPQNTGKAAFWSARAAAAGNAAAIDNLPRIVKDLPKAHVNANDVNIRTQPDGSARVVRQADSDAVVVVLSRDKDWTQVLFPKTYETGWVANFLLADSLAPLAGEDEARPPVATGDEAARPASSTTTTTTTASAAPASASGASPASSAPAPEPADSAPAADSAPSARRRIGVGTANLRAKPNRSGKVIGQLHRRDVVTVQSKQNGWARVRTERGTEGWVAGYLLTGNAS